MTGDRDTIDPVNHGTGEFQYHQVDLELPGVGMPFRLERYYRSRIAYNGPLGFNWTHSYHQTLEVSSTDCGTTVYTWQTGQGAAIRFERNTFGGFDSRPASPFKLVEGQDGRYVESQDGIRRYFDTWGLLSEIRDLNTNKMIFAWQRTIGGPGEGMIDAKVMTVTDTLGHTINFVYGSDGKLDSVQVPELFVSAHYEIDALGDLVSATNMGGIQGNRI